MASTPPTPTPTPTRTPRFAVLPPQPGVAGGAGRPRAPRTPSVLLPQAPAASHAGRPAGREQRRLGRQLRSLRRILHLCQLSSQHGSQRLHHDLIQGPLLRGRRSLGGSRPRSCADGDLPGGGCRPGAGAGHERAVQRQHRGAVHAARAAPHHGVGGRQQGGARSSGGGWQGGVGWQPARRLRQSVGWLMQAVSTWQGGACAGKRWLRRFLTRVLSPLGVPVWQDPRGMRAVPLTRDHKPGNTDERARIAASGGRVER